MHQNNTYFIEDVLEEYITVYILSIIYSINKNAWF